jgi:hypothetical protein
MQIGLRKKNLQKGTVFDDVMQVDELAEALVKAQAAAAASVQSARSAEARAQAAKAACTRKVRALGQWLCTLGYARSLRAAQMMGHAAYAYEGYKLPKGQATGVTSHGSVMLEVLPDSKEGRSTCVLFLEGPKLQVCSVQMC